MAVTFAGYPSIEVAATTIAAACLPGYGLTYNASGVLAASGGRCDAILMSEVIDDQTWMNRVHIYNDIDFGAMNRVGETSSVAKAFKGMTVMGLKMQSGNAQVNAGSALSLHTDGTWKLNPTQGTGDIAIALETIPASTTYSGRVHLL